MALALWNRFGPNFYDRMRPSRTNLSAITFDNAHHLHSAGDTSVDFSVLCDVQSHLVARTVRYPHRDLVGLVTKQCLIGVFYLPDTTARQVGRLTIHLLAILVKVEASGSCHQNQSKHH